MTVPGITPIDRGEWRDTWYWSFTAASTHRILQEHISSDLEVESYGNVLAATAFLHGIAAEELTSEELRYHDDAFQVIIAARVTKPAQRCRS